MNRVQIKCVCKCPQQESPLVMCSRSDDCITGRSICNFLRNHHGSVASSYQAVTHGTDASEGWQTSPPIAGQNPGALVPQTLSSIAVKVRHAEQQEIRTALEQPLPWTTAAEIPLLSSLFLRKSHSHPPRGDAPVDMKIMLFTLLHLPGIQELRPQNHPGTWGLATATHRRLA